MRRLPLLTALAASLALCSGCVPGETLQAAYPDLAAALADGAVSRGWVPPWLPASATELREIHNLDSNQSALSFRTGTGTGTGTGAAAAAWSPPAECVPVPAEAAVAPTLRLAGWPSAQRLREGFRLYRCKESGALTANFFAVSHDGMQGLYWRTHPR